MALLEIASLVFRLPTRPLLDGIDLNLAAGEIHALVGTNGTGKSTLAYLIMGCEGYRPDRGEIRFDGRRVDELPLFERARLVILDEPTAGIDLLSIQEIINVIANFKRGGSAVLLITHREEVTRIADRASQLCGGRIICSGDPGSVAAAYMGRACRRCDGRECHDE